jgi:5-methylcytosine-specific restriction endonuclease McrA
LTSHVPAGLAAEVEARAGGRCEYCHAPQILVGQTFHLDHIQPASRGGETAAANLCVACSHCNIAKGVRTHGTDPVTRRRVRLFNPRSDDWEAHFRWSNNWALLIGRTPEGRATIAALDMNSQLLKQARPFWRIVGLIP